MTCLRSARDLLVAIVGWVTKCHTVVTQRATILIAHPNVAELSLSGKNCLMNSVAATQVIWGEEDALFREGGSVYDEVTLTGKETEPVQVILSGK